MHPNTHICVHFIFEKKIVFEKKLDFTGFYTELVPEKSTFSVPGRNGFSVPVDLAYGNVYGNYRSVPVLNSGLCVCV